MAELHRLKKPGTTGLRYQGTAWTHVTVAALWDSVVRPVGDPLRRLSGVFSSSLASTTGAFTSSSMSPGHSSSVECIECIGFGTTFRVGSSIETFL